MNNSADTALPAQVRQWVGTTVILGTYGVPVEGGAVEAFCASVEDGNSLYWVDSEERVAPPAMVSTWAKPIGWTPSGADQDRPMELHFRLKEQLQLPKAIVMANELSFLEPVRLGDRIRAEQSLVHVSEFMESRFGPARKWTIDVIYRREDGAEVAIETMRFLGYGGDHG